MERPRASFVWRAAALAASVALVVAAAGWWQSARTANSLARQVEARPTPPLTQPTETEPGKSALLTELQAQVQEYERRQGALTKELETASAAVDGLENQVAHLTEPQLNTWNGTLEAGVYRGAEDEQTLPHDLMANVSLEARNPDTAREVTLVDAAGKMVWKPSVPLRRDREGYYSISFPAGFLKPGRYTLQLWSVENGERVQRESYALIVK